MSTDIGKTSDDFEDDPWSGVQREDVQELLERHVTEASESSTPSGRVLFPREHTSIGQALVALVSGDSDWQASARAELEGTGVMDVFSRYLDEPTEWVVKCSNSDSRVSGVWGLARFHLGRRGYIYDQPDEIAPLLRIVAAWEPVDDPEAWRACFLAAYAREWNQIGLPPLLGQWADGPEDLMVEAIVRALADSNSYWTEVSDTVEEGGGNGLPDGAKLQAVADRAGVSLQVVQRLVGHLRDEDAAILTRIRNGDLEVEERRAVVAIFLQCIQGGPFA